MTSVPSIKLRNGKEMPILGLGTSKSNHNDLIEAIKFAIDQGYRLIDCAWRYGNLEAVGKAIRAKIEDGTVKREELFVTTKLWKSFMRKEHIEECLDLSLKKLGLEYIDLFLIHFPQASLYSGLENYQTFDKSGKVLIDEDVHYTEVWNNLQKYQVDGRVKMLGVSNFNCYQLKKLLRECECVPVVNQIEVHPYLSNVELVELCKSHNITVTSFCTIGTADRQKLFGIENFPILLEDETLRKVAKKYGKSSAQIALRFCLERQIAVIPKSVTPSRITENMDVFDFKLDKDDMATLYAMNRNYRYMTSAYDSFHKHHPFRENYSEDA